MALVAVTVADYIKCWHIYYICIYVCNSCSCAFLYTCAVLADTDARMYLSSVCSIGSKSQASSSCCLPLSYQMLLTMRILNKGLYLLADILPLFGKFTNCLDMS